MIKIKKPSNIPLKLLKEGKIETEENKQLHSKSIRKFTFKREIYAHKEVKDVLRKAQHDKCCFCERKEEIGDVEHFRPKSIYYWLAYEWDNLFFCCPKCNRSYKRDWFPLEDDKERATSHLSDITREKPLFIHPEQDNPEDYIEFIADKPRAVNGNSKGKTTIEKIGLGRLFLDEERFKHYQLVKTIYHITQLPNISDEDRIQSQQMLQKYSQDSAKFASMIRCAIKHKFKY